ncbi:MAG: isoleucine--tRNA ligase [Thermoplasmata archaeon]|nr:isoleucine--tRNA ligase [Thermoplasmata archaeon]
MSAEEAEPSGIAPAVEVQRRVLAYWDASGTAQRLQAGSADGPIFRFTEGPPTANGAPHLGHLVARALKDVELRYRRMRGFRIVSPMAGWDCHGLPVELEIEKKHGLKSKKEIEAYGVAKFCEECRSGALEVAAVWQEMSRRLGYWLDYEHAYYTMSPAYIESVWWALRTLFDRGLLEKGHYVLPYCPRCETPLSSHEVAQGYRETTDPSVTVRFPLVEPPDGRPASLLVWTTTPWTLPSNLLIAARKELAYVAVPAEDGSDLWVAEPALSRYFPAGTPVRGRRLGSELKGWAYLPPFPYAGPGPGRYRVVLDAMVDASEGTGFVHIAPSFGIEDQRIGAREGVGVFDPLDSRGVFTAMVPPVAGKGFKAADALLLAELHGAGRLHSSGKVSHTYPFCWRCSNPLIYRAIDSWFVRTSRVVPELVANNQRVQWNPSHLRDGRFGNFLDEAKDWALSRNRYWGTPLPLWLCPNRHATCVGSFAELETLSGQKLPTPLDPHRMTVDAIQFPCPTCRETSRREPYTIDGWFDSGCAPFAQFHYPFEPGPFDPDAPLDYIAEGLDQTRGWFYTLLVLATTLFHRPAYRVCISNGLVLDESGLKMSKSRGNAVEPLGLLERAGADVVRLAFLLSDYTEPLKVSDVSIAKTGGRIPQTFLNVLEFHRQNALADRLPNPQVPPSPRALLDRWLLSRLDGTIEEVTASLEGFEPRRGAVSLRAFVDDLSTWYLRRSRPRFWSDADARDRRDAHDTLAFALDTTARLLAPLAPFTAEFTYQTLREHGFSVGSESVHGMPWPTPTGRRDPALEVGMAELRDLVEVGRELRQRAGVKSRIPLATLVLVGPGLPALGTDGDALLAEELNVRRIERLEQTPESGFSEGEWVVRSAGDQVRAALSRTPSAELRREGLRRETMRRLQQLRKELRLGYTDRVELTIFAEGELWAALEEGKDQLATELLADAAQLRDSGAPEDPEVHRWEIDGVPLAAIMRPRPPSVA